GGLPPALRRGLPDLCVQPARPASLLVPPTGGNSRSLFLWRALRERAGRAARRRPAGASHPRCPASRNRSARRSTYGREFTLSVCLARASRARGPRCAAPARRRFPAPGSSQADGPRSAFHLRAGIHALCLFGARFASARAELRGADPLALPIPGVQSAGTAPLGVPPTGGNSRSLFLWRASRARGPSCAPFRPVGATV